jgi:hypothetical protein
MVVLLQMAHPDFDKSGQQEHVRKLRAASLHTSIYTRLAALSSRKNLVRAHIFWLFGWLLLSNRA